ncbi:hypothetical protein OO013_05135 [Mangrovivirga sp. M17]|uniref:DUF3823 domain-containing protein n=1 Tax=Mangrovivirga halotolerans TaxID=2993936 RepID=A0ABT3RN52_9BACT|nr:hypothetical protein [Mangrovivirga halotolerans]MCX2743237.1 hypothetical protein [Mangrovivirga halotolerans]
MKTLQKIIYIYPVLLLLLTSSCREPIFIFDPGLPGLPIYTQRGNDVGGAIFNETQIWNSKLSANGLFQYYDYIPIICDTVDNKLKIKLPGYIINSSTSNYNEVDIIFEITNSRVKSFEDLLLLDQTEFDLASAEHKAYVDIDAHDFYYGREEDFQPINQIGKLHIRKLSGINRFILAGTFGFEYEDSVNVKHTVHQGRFDYNLSDVGFRYEEN